MFTIESLFATEFSWRLAMSLVMACQTASGPTDTIVQTATERWGFERCEVIETTYTKCLVGIKGDVVLVAFSGLSVQNLDDAMIDLSLLSLETTQRPYGEVHQGMYKEYSEVAERLQLLVPRNSSVWFTGHSFGGGLAQIAMLELNGKVKVSGCCTFGQPKIAADDSFDANIRNAFENKYWRVTNDADFISQLPLPFFHTGRVFNLSADGSIENADPETQTESIKKAFETLNAIEQSAEKIDEVNRKTVIRRSIMGSIPSLRAHELGNYIALVRSHAEPFNETDSEVQTDPVVNVAQAMRLGSQAIESMDVPRIVRGQSTDRLPILVRSRYNDWKPPEGVDAGVTIGKIHSLRATADQIQQLQSDRNVISIEGSPETAFTETSESVPFVKGDVVHRPPMEERGSKALIGIIDTGIDVLHQSFTDEAGNSRILFIWDQRSTGEATPAQFDAIHFDKLDYGTIYSGDQIAQMLAGTLPVPQSLRDPDGHGTHVASIAAGRKVGGFSGGMAPESGLIVVIPDIKTPAGRPPSLGYSNGHMEALQFLKSASSLLQRPMAVNVSLGMNAGGHDGKSNLEAVFDSITTMGTAEGLVIVKSAGNERGLAGHAAIKLFPLATEKLTWNSAAAYRQMDYIECWYNGGNDLEFQLESPSGEKTTMVSRQNPKFADKFDSLFCSITLTRFHSDNGDTQLSIQLYPGTQIIHPGEWTLHVHCKSCNGSDRRFDAWVERSEDRPVKFTTFENDNMVLSIPGTADTVISVAACHPALTPLQLTTTSSWGPTRDGDPKPDLSAPGFQITAARSNTNDHQDLCQKSGTSMAAPHVAGALALCLSHGAKQNPKRGYNANQLKQLLILTCQARDFLHHEGFGFGILDTEALMLELQRLP